MNKTLLLVEDEIYVRELYERVLVQGGFTVICAKDGEEALELVKKTPDLILLDIMLPKINGLKVLKKLKSDPVTKKIPIIILSNLGNESILRQAFILGADGYMMKIRYTPYDIVEKMKKFFTSPTPQNSLKM